MRPSFPDAWRSFPLFLTEGAVVERLRRGGGARLDPHVANAAALYDPEGREALADIYRGYVRAARAAGFPLLLLTPTWRAHPERLERAGLAGRPVQADAVHLLDGLRGDGPVFIGGLMGCRGDAYDPREALTVPEAERYHRLHADALARAGVEFLYGATLPALSEALGMARAMAATGLPYFLGFPLRPAGTLLDGSPLAEAVERLDAAATPAAQGYMGHCIHPSVFEEAMEAAFPAGVRGFRRWVGLQANASSLSPEELDGADRLHGDAPPELAWGLARAARRWGLRLAGGCCGTDERLIAPLSARLRADD